MLKPGSYVNKRGEVLNLIPYAGNDNLLTDEKESRYYTHSGTCLMYLSSLERLVMDIDPKSDLQLLPPTPAKCSQCNRDF